MSAHGTLLRRAWAAAALLAAGWILLAGAVPPAGPTCTVLPVSGPIGPEPAISSYASCARRATAALPWSW